MQTSLKSGVNFSQTQYMENKFHENTLIEKFSYNHRHEKRISMTRSLFENSQKRLSDFETNEIIIN